MNTTVDQLVIEVERKLATALPGRRILIGLCGIPGSGKSQLAAHVVDAINGNARRRGAQDDVAVIVGMDGWHWSREKLAAMPDPQLAKDKRGAPWTFDDESFASFVEQLRTAPITDTLHAPSFSHAKKDPVADDIAVLPEHRVVLLEGLYANVDEGAWRRASSMYDDRWVMECDEGVARARLVERHVQTGVAESKEEAEWRADKNDLPNGRYLLDHVHEPARRIASHDDAQWRGAE